MTLDFRETIESVETEAALISAILTNNDILIGMPWLDESHFYEPVHKRIFSVIRDKYNSGEHADPVSLRPIFDKDPSLSDIGGGQYLTKIMPMAMFVHHPVDVARQLVDLWGRRQILEVCQSAIHSAIASTGRTPDEIIASLHAGLINADIDPTRRKTETDQKIFERLFDSIGKRGDMFPTGIKALDRLMGGGLISKKAYGFAARKKVGKTALAGTISYNLAVSGIRHMYIAAEMGTDEIMERMYCRAAGFYPSAWRSGFSESARFREKLWEVKDIFAGNIISYNAPSLTFDALRSTLAASVHKDGIKGFILDYWQLVGGKSSNKPTSEHLDEVAQWIASFCKEKGLWAVVMAQINQDGNTRGSEGIRLAFDQVYQLRGMGSSDDISQPDRWIEMMDTRYTAWGNVGSENSAGLSMNDKGVFFEEVA